nr:hypothetical protein [Nonomuraea cavernae]
MNDPAARRALSENGERFVRDRLSWARAAKETVEVYRVAAAGPPRHSRVRPPRPGSSPGPAPPSHFVP